MLSEIEKDVITKGLSQVGRDGLLRIKKHIEDGGTVLFDGNVCDRYEAIY